MSYESELYTLVQSKTSITDYIGTRFYPDELEQGTPVPAARYFRVETVPYRQMKGASGSGLIRLQIDIYAGDTLEAQKIQELFKSELDGYEATDDEAILRYMQFLNAFPFAETELSYSRKIIEFYSGYRE